MIARLTGLVLVAWFVGGCIEAALVPCGELACPVGSVCTLGGCARPDAAAACASLDDGAPCVAESVPGGTCWQGSCHPVECGNGILDAGEACDDGNNAYGDDCSADCLSTLVCGNGVPDPTELEECDRGVAGLSGDGCTSLCTFEIEVWREREPAPLAARYGARMVFDAARGVSMLYGGQDGFTIFGDTGEWDGVAWRRRAPHRSPGARSNVAMAYDSVRSRVVLFGGVGVFLARYGDTWEWDGVTWTERSVAQPPPARVNAAMAYDPVRQRIVMFGGNGQSGALADTWEWDGTSWTQHAIGAGPPPRVGAAMAYDADLGTIVLFGGLLGVNPLDDLWQWDGAVWTQLSPTVRPSARHEAALVATPDGLLLYGGALGLLGAASNEVWRWDGASLSWSLVGTTGTPSGRSGSGVSYDEARGVVVVFAGRDGVGTSLADTHELAGTVWTAQPTPAGPGARHAHGMAYDARRGQVVLYGGITTQVQGMSTTVQLQGDTWEWDGLSWRLDRTPLPATPGRRYGHAMIYDEARGVTLVFGGATLADPDSDDTWTWDGETWTALAPLVRPPGRRSAAIAYDRDRERVLLYGGVAGDPNEPDLQQRLVDLWEWDGAEWTPVPTGATTPGPRQSAAMAYDASRQRVVLVGGVGDSSGFAGTNVQEDVWEWDGTSWSLRVASILPLLPRAASGIAYDPLRGRVMLFGGFSVFGAPLDETLEWDGAALVRRSPALVPGPRSSSPLVYSARQRAALVVGGLVDVNTSDDDVWVRSFESEPSPPERCDEATADTDGDGLAGCADPDCFARCAPLCPPGLTCSMLAPRCGNGQCGPVEDYLICPTDCPAP